MRRFLSLLAASGLLAAQVGFSYTAVCRILMDHTGTEAAHCESVRLSHAQNFKAGHHAGGHPVSGCAGRGGCAELCRGLTADFPMAPGKSGNGGDQILAGNPLAAPAAPQAAMFLSGGDRLWPSVFCSQPFKAPIAEAFILFGSLLI